MTEQRLTYTLLVDGSSDRSLTPMIEWALDVVGCDFAANGAVVTPSMIRGINPAATTLIQKIPIALDLFPCDLLIIHRDAEGQGHKARVDEIQRALRHFEHSLDLPINVPIVPIRMLEAWLLFSEDAIRRAAGNPNGKSKINLPAVKDLEGLPDPKETLDDLLKDATEFSGHRLKRFSCSSARSRVADYLDDFAPIRSLSAVQHFLRDLSDALKSSSWIRSREPAKESSTTAKKRS